MSSPSSDTDSETSELPPRVEPLLQNNQNGHDEVRVRRAASNTTPYMTSEDHMWAQRSLLGHGAAAGSLSPSRSTSSGQVESSRYSTAPLSISNMPVEVRRQNIMAMDRKRRLTGSTHDTSSRRRTVASGFSERNDTAYNRVSDNHASSSRSPTSYQRHRTGPGSSAEVIDLTSSPPQATLTPPSLTRRSSGSTSGIYVVPRWQPDSEVTECPICRRPFTFLFRRHHCRKCGRVVCNDCSPHRITIPRQFIVNPPGPSIQVSSIGRDTVDLTGDDDDDDDDDDNDAQHQIPSNHSRQFRNTYNPGIGGGEKVRLCNPCVPDPQPEPQPNYTSTTLPASTGQGRRDDLLTLSDALRSSRHDFHSHSTTESFPGFVPQHTLSYASQSSRARPLPLPPQSRGEVGLDASQLGQFSYLANDVGTTHGVQRTALISSQRYRQRGHMSYDGPPTIHHRHHSSESSRVPPQPLTRPRMRSMLDESYLPRMFAGHAPPSRPRLNEEDICPICRRALPPKSPGGDETAREAHIMDCISSRDPANQTSSNRGVGPLSPPRGPMHMLPFVATEKDCVGDDGNIPECSICMVEYDVGDELARLECLCKFHRECISEWFTRKQECPVHKIA